MVEDNGWRWVREVPIEPSLGRSPNLSLPCEKNLKPKPICLPISSTNNRKTKWGGEMNTEAQLCPTTACSTGVAGICAFASHRRYRWDLVHRSPTRSLPLRVEPPTPYIL